GLEEHYIWPVNAEQQATPQQIAAIIETVRDQDVPAVFCESTVSDAPMQQVVEATGARFGGTLYVDSLSEPGGPVPTYLELLRHDADVIVAGLTGTEGQAWASTSRTSRAATARPPPWTGSAGTSPPGRGRDRSA